MANVGNANVNITAEDAQARRVFGSFMSYMNRAGRTGAQTVSTSMRNVLSNAERNALVSGTRIGNNLSSSIGNSSHRIIQDFQRTGQRITEPIVQANLRNSQSFRDLANASSQTSGGIIGGFRNMVGSVRNFASNAISQSRNIISSVSNIAPQIVSASSSIGSSIERGLVAPFRSAIGMVKQYGAAIGVLSAGSLIGAGINRLSAIEDARIALTVMLGDAKKVQGFMDEVLAFAKTTPFAFPQLATAAKNMVAFGMDTKKVVPTLKAVGDAAAASGRGAEGLDMITTAFGQMQISAKLSLGPIRSLEASGVPALKILANQAGISADQMEKQISKGAIDSKAAIDILVKGIEEGSNGIAGETKKMGGVMEEMKNSWRGSVDSLKSSISSTMATIMEPAVPHIRDFMKFFGDQFKKLPDVVNAAVEAIRPAFEYLKPVFLDVANAISTSIIPAIKNMLPILEPVGVAIVAAFKIIGEIIVKVVAPAFKMLGDFMKEHSILMRSLVVGIMAVVASIYTAGKVITIITTLKNVFMALKSATSIIKGITAVMRVFNLTLLANPVVLIVTAIIAAVAALVAAFIYLYKENEKFRAFVDGFVQGIKDGFQAVINWFTETLPAWWQSVVDGFGKMIDGIVAWFKDLGAKIMAILQPFFTFFTQSWENLKLVTLGIIEFFIGLVTGNFDKMKLGLLAIWTGVKDQAINYWTLLKDTVIKLIIALWNGAISWFGSLKDSVVSYIKNTKDNVVNGFRDAKDGAIQKIKDMWDGIVSWISKIPGKFTEMKTNVVKEVKSIDLYQIGKDIVQGLLNGLGSMVKAVKDKAREISNAVEGAIRDKLKLKSPSRVMIDIGKDTGGGFIIGMDDMIAAAVKKAKELGQAVTDGISGYGQKAFDFKTVQSQMSNLIGGFPPLEILKNTIISDSKSAPPREQHIHYWQINADEISDVSRLIDVVNGIVQSVRSR